MEPPPPLSQSPSQSQSSPPSTESLSSSSAIPIEIISEEEMAFLEAALASARPRFPLIAISSPVRTHAISIRSISSSSSQHYPVVTDIEDVSGPNKSLLQRFRARKGLTVTDITASEWCQKRTEFSLTHGKPEQTKAMKAGCNRHAELEMEVIKKVKICTKSLEDTWAVKFLNFITGANQLQFEGLTRELPVIGVYRGMWIVGVIDELRIEDSLNPILVDTKTRSKATLPAEAQKRNARFQLMCYKYIWDQLASSTFPTEYFFDRFKLNPQYILSEDVKQYTALLGFDAKTFEELVSCFSDSCSFLCPSHDQLILRYELQSDRSLLKEDQFAYDEEWFKSQLDESTKFWSGEKGASYVPKSETWKCRFCEFTTICQMASNSKSTAN